MLCLRLEPLLPVIHTLSRGLHFFLSRSQSALQERWNSPIAHPICTTTGSYVCMWSLNLSWAGSGFLMHESARSLWRASEVRVCDHLSQTRAARGTSSVDQLRPSNGSERGQSMSTYAVRVRLPLVVAQAFMCDCQGRRFSSRRMCIVLQEGSGEDLLFSSRMIGD